MNPLLDTTLLKQIRKLKERISECELQKGVRDSFVRSVSEIEEAVLTNDSDKVSQLWKDFLIRSKGTGFTEFLKQEREAWIQLSKIANFDHGFEVKPIIPVECRPARPEEFFASLRTKVNSSSLSSENKSMARVCLSYLIVECERVRYRRESRTMREAWDICKTFLDLAKISYASDDFVLKCRIDDLFKG
ncbi:hypothetical protein [Bdellovibrio sp. BCCA]|uniref:hypothetical protein n=1 Tax=Bdellovibrio sp. BCCA TaxID=3136281 RepID=UPI0030F0E205